MSSKKSEKLITKIEKAGQPGGNLYGVTDVSDGEWSVEDLIARQDATAQAFVDRYQTDSMGIGTEAPGRVPKPTPAVVKQY